MPKPYFQVDDNGNLIDPNNPGGTTDYAVLLCTISNIMKLPNLNDRLSALCEVKDTLNKMKNDCNC